MVADITLSWVAARASVTDWVAWALVCVISVVYIDVTVIALPVLVTATMSEFVIVHMVTTVMGVSMSVVSVIGEVTVVSVETVVTRTVSPCIHVGVVAA